MAFSSSFISFFSSSRQCSSTSFLTHNDSSFHFFPNMTSTPQVTNPCDLIPQRSHSPLTYAASRATLGPFPDCLAYASVLFHEDFRNYARCASYMLSTLSHRAGTAEHYPTTPQHVLTLPIARRHRWGDACDMCLRIQPTASKAKCVGVCAVCSTTLKHTLAITMRMAVSPRRK